jgi:hypothetical protein
MTMGTSIINGALEAVSATRLQQHLEWFARVRRDTGGGGEDAASDYIRAQLLAAGVPVTVHEFDAFLSYPVRATLMASGRTFRALTHSFAVSTPAEGVSAELVHVTPERLHEASGRIALVDGLAMPVTILQASRARCAGVVFANDDRVIHNMIGTTIWGTPGIDQIDRLPTVPVASVSRDSGDALKSALAQGAVRATLTTEVSTGWVKSRLPEARIPGATEPDTFVLLGGHYCAWDVGVTDNATGDACLIEAARVLWNERERLGRSVRICWWPGHSHGRYSGSTWYADTFFVDLAEHCVAYQNVDSPGVRDATWYVGRHTCSELETYCRGVIEEVTGQLNAPVHRPARAADQSFLANGVASFSAYPFLPEGHPDRRPWTGGSGNAWWWHTDEDTLDKADVGILATDTRLAITAMMQLSNVPLLPFDYAATGSEIAGILETIARRVGAAFDLSPAIAEARRLIVSAQSLDAARPASAADPEKRRRFNTLVLRLGRVLNPTIYSASGRYHHDPADWTPMLRAKAEYRLSGLSKAAALPELQGHPDHGFLHAQLVRERNRLVTALREASALILESGLVAES